MLRISSWADFSKEGREFAGFLSNQSVFLKDGTDFDKHHVGSPLFFLLLSMYYIDIAWMFVFVSIYLSTYPVCAQKYVFVCVHICICLFACTNMHAHPETILFKHSYTVLIRCESVLPFHHVILRSLTLIIKLDCKHCSPLNHLTSPFI